MIAHHAVIRPGAGFRHQIFRLLRPVVCVIGTKNAQPFPLVNDHPEFIVPAETFRPFAPAFESENFVRPVHEVGAVGVIDGFPGALVVIPQPPRTIRHSQNTGINHAVGRERKFFRIRPVQQIRAGELHDETRMIPVFENSRHNREKHLPRSVRRTRHVRRPFGDIRAAVFRRQFNLGHADEFPVRAAIGRFRDADGRAVNPRHAGLPRRVRAAIRVKHPPFFHERVPDQGRIRRAVINRIAIKRLGGNRAGIIRKQSGRKQQTSEEKAGAFHGREADIQIAAEKIKRREMIPLFSALSFGRENSFHLRMVPCVNFEDEHLLVVNKPAGWNTLAPSPYASEGIYDWLRHREPRWATLAILHRLDKETSGVLVFGKTPLANRSLTEQFTQHRVRKKYLLLTDREVPQKDFTVKTALVRVGEKYASRPGGEMAETKFCRSRGDEAQIKIGNRKSEIGNELEPPHVGCYNCVEASPLTGRTHQIRVHAAESGFPILGDTLYGGTPAARVFLHAAEISFTHPATGKPVTFQAPANFDAIPQFGGASVLASRKDDCSSGSPGVSPHLLNPNWISTDPRLALRAALIDPQETDAFRVIHGASDGWPGWYVERLGKFLLSQSEQPLRADQREELARLAKIFSAGGAYHKILSRQVRRTTTAEASPQPVWGEAAPERFEICENGVRFELGFNEGCSTGLFLDQRDNRRRFLTNHIAADFPQPSTLNYQLLNCFAYTRSEEHTSELQSP